MTKSGRHRHGLERNNVRKITVRERKMLESVFAAIEANLSIIAKDGIISMQDASKSVTELYDNILGDNRGAIVLTGKASEGRSAFMGIAKMNDQPMTTWPDAEEEVLRGGDKE